MSRIVVRHLSVLLLAGTGLLAAPADAGEYDFSAVTRQMSDNLDMYGGNVLVIVQQGDKEIFRFQAGETQENTKYGPLTSEETGAPDDRSSNSPQLVRGAYGWSTLSQTRSQHYPNKAG